MTGYHLSPGYSSCYGAKGSTWPLLKDIAESMEYQVLLKEYLDSGGAEVCDEGCCLATDAAHYMTDQQGIDSSCVILDEDEQVMLLASSGGHTRQMKEKMRRAFCRLVLKAADAIDLEVNINVV